MHWDTFKQDNYSTVGGMGDVGSARYEPALLPPCLTIKILTLEVLVTTIDALGHF